MTIVTLQTPRLLLRMFRQDDIDAYARICADPEVMRFLGGAPLSRAEAWRQMAMFLGHCPSPAAQRLHDLHLIRGAQRQCQVAHLFVIDENAHVRPQRVLLVDHTETDAGVPQIEIHQQLC